MRTALSTLALTVAAAPVLVAQADTILRPADIVAGLDFGAAVALDGTKLLVGAPGNGGTVPGRAYVFRRATTGWVEEAMLPKPSGASALGFGRDVRLLGKYAFVGDEDYVNTSGNASGAVFVYESTGTSWGPPTLLLPSDATTASGFGHDIAADSGRVVVAGDAQAYLFAQSGGAWTETATLAGEAKPLQDLDLRRRRAVLTHSTAFVFEEGASGWDAGTQLDSVGTATLGSNNVQIAALAGDHVAAMSLTGFTLLPELHGHDRVPGGWWKTTKTQVDESGFMHTVEMDGDRLVAASDRQLEVYRALPSGGWIPEESFSALIVSTPGATTGDADISGDLAVLGIPGDDFVVDGGAVHVFELAPLTGLPQALSVVSGGTQELELRRSPLQAASFYWISGSAGGTSPGLTVDGVPFPLNLDAYFLFLASSPNTVVVPSAGLLDGKGEARSQVTFPPLDPSLVGTTLNHAYLTIDLAGPVVDFASNAVPLRLSTEFDLPPEDFEAGAPDWNFIPPMFGFGFWKVVDDGVCGAVTRMAAFTSDAPACGSNFPSSFPIPASLASSSFRLGELASYELRLSSIRSGSAMPRIRLFVDAPVSAYFEIAWPEDFDDTGVLESLSFDVPGIEYAIGEEAQLEFLVEVLGGGTSPTGWWIDDVELVQLP